MTPSCLVGVSEDRIPSIQDSDMELEPSQAGSVPQPKYRSAGSTGLAPVRNNVVAVDRSCGFTM